MEEATTTLACSHDRAIDICARRATVFRFFTDPERFARWWGAGSTIEPVIGGRVVIRYPDGSTASGTLQAIVPDERAFTYGCPRSAICTCSAGATRSRGPRVRCPGRLSAARQEL